MIDNLVPSQLSNVCSYLYNSVSTQVFPFSYSNLLVLIIMKTFQDGDTIFTASTDKTIGVFDTMTGK